MGWVLFRRDGGSFFAFPSTRGIVHRASKLSCPGGGVHRFRGRAWGRARGVRLRVGARVSRRASPGMLSRGAPGILGSVWGSAAGFGLALIIPFRAAAAIAPGYFVLKLITISSLKSIQFFGDYSRFGSCFGVRIRTLSAARATVAGAGWIRCGIPGLSTW